MGAAAVEALKTLSDGGTVEKVIAVPVTIVTKENVEPYRAIVQVTSTEQHRSLPAPGEALSPGQPRPAARLAARDP